MIQRFFYWYVEWRDKACFEAHIATPHVKHAEDLLKREKMLIEPAERMFTLERCARLAGVADRKDDLTRAPFISFCRCRVATQKDRISRT